MHKLAHLSAIIILTSFVMGTVPSYAQTHGSTGDHTSPGKAHKHGENVAIAEGPNAPSVNMTLSQDTVGGWNLHVKTKNFRFAPEHASGKHVPGEGHAHIYVNGKKIARLYGPWFHIPKLPTNGAAVRVTLNANDHRDYVVGGKVVSATQSVGTKMKSHGHK